MDNIRVYINNTEVGYYKMEDTGVAFTWQAKLIDEINSFSTTTTKTITLPLTDTLKTLLKNPEIIDSTMSLTNREYFSIKIDWNSTLAINGWIKLQRVVVLENDEYIEFSVEPKEKDWITEFKDFKLTELDFTITPDQRHALTYANIVTSETLLPLTREYVYAPIDIAEVGRLQVLWVVQPFAGAYDYYYVGAPKGNFRGNSYGFGNSTLTRYDEGFINQVNAFWNSRGVYVARPVSTMPPISETLNQTGYIYVLSDSLYSWEVGDFYPSVRHSAILRRCFERIGYVATIIDSDDYFDDKYNFLHNVEQLNEIEKKRADNNYFKTKVNFNGYLFVTFGGGATNPLIMPFMNVVQGGLQISSKYTDTNSNVQSNIDAATNISRFTATEGSIMRFVVNYELTTGAAGAYTTVLHLRLRQYSSGGTLRRTEVIRIMSFSDTASEFDSGTCDSSFFYLIATDYVLCELYADSASAVTTIEIGNNCTMESFMYQGGNFKDKTIRLNEYLPDRTAYDYLKDLSLINNWEFYTNEKLKQVYIVREDYKRTGEQIDFTDKLNRRKEVELEEVGLQWPKKIYFNWMQDKDDWCIKFIEMVTKASLGTAYDPEELEMASRFGMGLITNLNLFTIEVQEFLNDVYAASLDKYDTSNRINFNTVEMKGEEQWPHPPSFKRTDYEPRYLTVTFGETLEDEGVGGVSSVVYQIENNTNHTTYPRVEFQTPLHYGGAAGLLATKYAKRTRAIKYGWILRARFDINENDVNTFVEVYEKNNFRGDYALQLKGVKQRGELLKVNDFSPATFDQTEIEFVIYRDDL